MSLVLEACMVCMSRPAPDRGATCLVIAPTEAARRRDLVSVTVPERGRRGADPSVCTDPVRMRRWKGACGAAWLATVLLVRVSSSSSSFAT